MTTDHDRPAADPAFLTIEQIAAEKQVSTKTVRRWIAAGELQAHRFGRQLRVSRADNETFNRIRRGS